MQYFDNEMTEYSAHNSITIKILTTNLSNSSYFHTLEVRVDSSVSCEMSIFFDRVSNFVLLISFSYQFSHVDFTGERILRKFY
jgi:hypothetical protein